jgi:hypothetical protein
MSLLRKPAQLIAPESARLLREARRARRQGFSKVADELAMQSFEQKSKEPTIWRSGERQAMADLKQGLAQAEFKKAQENATQQIAGRQVLADQIKQKAARGDEDTFDYASQEAPKYGVTAGALADFFQRNKLNYGRPTAKVEGASGVQGAGGLKRAIDLPGAKRQYN